MKYQTFRKLLCALLGIVLVSLLALEATDRASAAGSIIYVKYNAIGAGTGASWTDAYPSLQSALGAAASGDQIWVAKGTYRPGTTRSASFLLRNGVAIYGGFVGTEASLGQRNPAVNVTILSGDIGEPGTVTDNSYHVVIGSNTDSTAILDGFKILAGMADGTGPATSEAGGGMYNSLGAPTLRNLTFSGNRAMMCGAGMFNYGSSPRLTDVIFNGNNVLPSGTGGGICNVASSKPVLNNATFSNNTALAGGGMYNTSSIPTLTNVTFNGNAALGVGAVGGGIFNSSGGAALWNVTFSGNSAPLGAGIMNQSASIYVYNGLFWANGTNEIFNSGATAATTIANSIVKGGCPAGSICPTPVINADPKLGALQNNGGFTQTMALGAGSAAIDAGSNATCPPKDQRGVARPAAGRCDIGAYEVKAVAIFSQGAYDGWVPESARGSNVGGTPNSTANTLRVGDDAANRQYRAFLSFNTSGLPNNATIVLAKVSVRRYGIIGTKPFTTHGTLWVDVVRPYFGSGLGLAASDWQAGATAIKGGTIGPTVSGGFFTGVLNAAGRAAISKTATTQLRLRFNLKTNNDNGADYLNLYSGNASLSAYKPVLIVYYNP